jgi:glutamine synthetase
MTKLVKDENVKHIQLWFTDILGNLKMVEIPDRQLHSVLESGAAFDGSSISGYAEIEESDIVAMPDWSTFKVLPWAQGSERTAFVFCDVLDRNYKPFEGDPRWVLRRQLERAQKMGLDFYVGPELEYFYFANDTDTDVLDQAGYFDGLPTDRGTDLRRQTIFALQSMGIRVEYSHHEVAPSQHEIDLRYLDALQMADTVMTYRVAVKEIARQNGVYATFMPKPIFGQNGSGMHVHQSIFKGSKNTFFDTKDKYHLSATAKSYIAGIMRHAREITAVTNQWVNSYKRLVPGYEAPVYCAWARRNRSAMVRVPMYKPGKEKATRIEFRSPDPTCNPYLAFALMLGAGLKGVEGKYPLADPVEHDIFEMDARARAEAGITSLPGSLWEALEEFKQSVLANEVLGDHIFGKVIANKEKEWDMFRTYVTDFEINRYLPML